MKVVNNLDLDIFVGNLDSLFSGVRKDVVVLKIGQNLKGYVKGCEEIQNANNIFGLAIYNGMDLSCIKNKEEVRPGKEEVKNVFFLNVETILERNLVVINIVIGTV